MVNKIQEGKTIDVVLGADAAPGSVLQVGDVVGVVVAGGLSGEKVAVDFCGVFALPKTAGSSTGVAQGTKVYWDNSAHVVTATATSNKVIGYMWAASIDADTTAAVRLLG